MKEVDTHMGWLVAYATKPGLSASEKSLLQNHLHTHVNYSFYGKYRYTRKGLLDEIPHVQLIRGVFIIRDEDYERLCTVLEEYAVVHARRGVLTEEDQRQLDVENVKGEGGE